MLNNIKTLQNDRGFTIVQLLIVIVIIAILAAITIVAYTNISTRAADSAYSADANSIQKVAEVYYTENGSYPISAANFAAASTAKLPANIIVAPTTGTVTNAVATTSCGTVGTQTWAVCTSGSTKTYSIKVNAPCSATVGINIYYPQTVAGGALQTAKAGAGC